MAAQAFELNKNTSILRVIEEVASAWAWETPENGKKV
jgi:hypothetical protein